jgi:hypothetical protein
MYLESGIYLAYQDGNSLLLDLHLGRTLQQNWNTLALTNKMNNQVTRYCSSGGLSLQLVCQHILGSTQKNLIWIK